MENLIFIGPVTQLLTLSGLPVKGAVSNGQLLPLENAGILIKGDRIYKTGAYISLQHEARNANALFVVPDDAVVAMPGLIDAHTHICFAGSRASDYSARNAGKTYLEIAAAGGGIMDSVLHTRQASKEVLTSLTLKRVHRHLEEGVTTIEIKSGYGLSIAEELKILQAIHEANVEAPSDLISTCLAAHTVAYDYSGSAGEYLDEIDRELLPILLSSGLSHRVDIFIESTAFSVGQAEVYLAAAKRKGFDLTVHADQFTTGGSLVAVSLGALSADHLEASTDREIAALANSETVAVALPGASVGLGCAFAPARKLLDNGASLAIASDWNPGSAPMGDLIAVASLLGAYEKLTDAEVFAGMTFRAAKALGLKDRGRIEPGYLADLIMFPAGDYREILYHQGKLKPSRVMKSGKFVV